ncbi:hypothetical protein PF005_g10261 [Phytophthora fragariae]|uniref:Uncharacterized protein n=1 Tax=Phytophthora fragariae TaxID=53985 RepID=A0A6A3RPT2_9STRA|nr:hypothetical protein PF009_g12128 [Phytophthora fragariae]KAE9021818.1 hypothetical protein PF011_g4765 [Phytophthora fragariae]KAE9095046.1 hypothetical protein PF007_g17543 [Phytophthora fragariae]KAE9101629.1 hypothetical protein PF006_g22627 [Phytophthora fragariae]KAE9103563.1 hypothetical protein PF010_g13693 [Phytophthora fragariae]
MLNSRSRPPRGSRPWARSSPAARARRSTYCWRRDPTPRVGAAQRAAHGLPQRGVDELVHRLQSRLDVQELRDLVIVHDADGVAGHAGEAVAPDQVGQGAPAADQAPFHRGAGQHERAEDGHRAEADLHGHY